VKAGGFSFAGIDMAEDQVSTRALRLTISGRVQGVSYRAWTRAEALVHGLKGWVRNRANGDVETLIIGAPQVVNAFCDLCRDGPPLARVDRILTEEPAPEDFALVLPDEPFAILPTF